MPVLYLIRNRAVGGAARMWWVHSKEVYSSYEETTSDYSYITRSGGIDEVRLPQLLLVPELLQVSDDLAQVGLSVRGLAGLEVVQVASDVLQFCLSQIFEQGIGWLSSGKCLI